MAILLEKKEEILQWLRACGWGYPPPTLHKPPKAQITQADLGYVEK